MYYSYYKTKLWYIYNMNICLRCKESIESSVAPVYGLHEACFNNWFGCVAATEFTELNPQNSSEPSRIPELKVQKNTFFHGRYLKYSARLAGVQYDH